MDQEEVTRCAELVWAYHHMNHTLEKSDCILVLGSHDTRVAEWAADLYHQGWAPYIIFSGGLGNLTLGIWKEAEADVFARIARERGVPADCILVENRSTNTGENITFTQELLDSRGLNPQKFIVVQKPYMERRSYATFKRWWPDKLLAVTSPPISLADYPTAEISRDDVIHVMTGDLQRIKEYPMKGFQIAQDIPADVWDAFKQLVALGFTRHLLST
eukprot:TRINITY_DN1888_c0_g3_i1.p2 TRINITY_DN1888_c0_g3~~TRINITY_DN1888_c0_g3_i1.p2  ORF type:complete len:217 (+),score=35.05 TRINITY_DN1888_c0_g3_i1:103-753(+)